MHRVADEGAQNVQTMAKFDLMTKYAPSASRSIARMRMRVRVHTHGYVQTYRITRGATPIIISFG